MSVRIEWVSTHHAHVQVLAPGDEWVGADQQDDAHVITISNGGGELTAVHGSRERIERFARDLYAAVFPDTIPVAFTEETLAATYAMVDLVTEDGFEDAQLAAYELLAEVWRNRDG